MKICIAEKENLPACLDVIHRSFRTVAEAFRLTQENCPKHTSFMPLYDLEAQKTRGWHMFMLVHEEEIIGYMSLSKESDTVYELHNLAVLPEYRHRGCGAMLIDSAKQTVKALGGQTITIGIIEENSVLKQWYALHGFLHTGTKKFDHLPFVCGYMQCNL